MPTLQISRMVYRCEAIDEWKQSCDMLTSSRACEYLKRILSGKVTRRGVRTRRFFGEAFVATQIAHQEGYYGSFQWLTSPQFLSERPFPAGPTHEFQTAYRIALHRHFPGQLDRLQRNARSLEERTGVRPAAPDLWLIDVSGKHRFIEVKLPHDHVRQNQLAGLAVIARSLASPASISVEVIELSPDAKVIELAPGTADRFAEFLQHLVAEQRGEI